MKIYSWNMFCFNTRQQAAFDFIAQADFDIFCLQEVPEKFLERLKTLPFHIASASDNAFFIPGGKLKAHHTVILSRFVIGAFGKVAFPAVELPWQARMFHSFNPYGSSRKSVERGCVWADMDIPGAETTRVFSVHLTLSSPSSRAKEFEMVAENLPPGRATILAGDFNVIEHPAVKSFNWFLGSSLKESHPWHNERKHIEEKFNHYRFQNPLRGKVTHGISQSQLDHILVPESWSITEARVSKEKYGSDHRPVFITLKD